MKKILKLGFFLVIIAFIAIQFINRPDKTVAMELSQDDVTKKLSVPENVHGILKRACFDCHSNQTKWPWYSSVAPVSWLVADDVTKGRKKMNFSEWGKIPQSKQELRLEDIGEQVKSNEMPLPKYLIIHSEAKLTDGDIDILCKWTVEQKKKLSGE